MPSSREMRMRIKSVKNLSQVTGALETVAASKVRRAIQADAASRPYSEKAWKVLLHLAKQPGHASLHPLLTQRPHIHNVLVIMISSDTGLAGSYNVNILRNTLLYFDQFDQPVDFVCVGKKGRDLLLRRRAKVVAEFTEFKSPVNFLDVSPISHLIVEDFLNEKYDQVFLSYTQFDSMSSQQPIIRKLLPLEVDQDGQAANAPHPTSSVFSYEPDAKELLDEIIPRFTAMQIYQAILSSQASEHAARMVAMKNASDNASNLVDLLQLEYNKIRQQKITSEMLDIVGGTINQ